MTEEKLHSNSRLNEESELNSSNVSEVQVDIHKNATNAEAKSIGY